MFLSHRLDYFNCVYILYIARIVSRRMADSSLVELFKSYSELLKVLKNHTKGTENPVIPTDLSALWNHIDDCMKYISHQCTKLSLACESPPFPSAEELLPLLRQIETACINLVSACMGLQPSVHGSTFKALLVDSVDSVLESVAELFVNLSESCSKKRSKYLMTTGQVWSVADNFSSLPKNNKEAVLMRMKELARLLQDAHKEFDEAIKESMGEGEGKECDMIDELDDDMDDFDVKWNPMELEMAMAVLGMIKTTRICLSKVAKAVEMNGSVNPSSTENGVENSSAFPGDLLAKLTLAEGDHGEELDPSSPTCQLDVLLSTAKVMSPMVDNLICSIYPPISEVSSARNKVQKLDQLLRDFLKIARSSHFFIPSVDNDWLEFLSSAVSHNVNKTLCALDKFDQ